MVFNFIKAIWVSVALSILLFLVSCFGANNASVAVEWGAKSYISWFIFVTSIGVILSIVQVLSSLYVFIMHSSENRQRVLLIWMKVNVVLVIIELIIFVICLGVGVNQLYWVDPITRESLWGKNLIGGGKAFCSILGINIICLVGVLIYVFTKRNSIS